MDPHEIDEQLTVVVNDIKRGNHAGLSTYEKLAPVYDFLFAETYENELQANYVDDAVNGRPTSLLEVGCGTGRLLRMLAERFPHAAVEGIDLHEEMVELSQQRVDGVANASVHQADFFEWEGAYDLIVAFNTLPHFGGERLDAFFEHAASLLTPGSVLVFDYKDPRNNPNGLYDVWNTSTDKFSITTRFLTIYGDPSHYAISYEFVSTATGETHWTGELMEIAFQTPEDLTQRLRAVGADNIDIDRGVGDQSGIVTVDL